MLLMLEDDADRLARFAAVVHVLDPTLELRVWREAWKMIREVGPLLPQGRLISLDHDLDPEEGCDDPGTGWEVTKVLAALPPCCPVILHTSNGERGTWMMGEFHLGGWEYHRVAALGDDWIEAHWRHVARKLLRRPDRLRASFA
jgi:hypothetical protein